MLLPKKACLAVRRGYFSPPVVIILALITFAVAFVIYFNRGLILKTKKNQTTQQTATSPSPISKSSPSPSADETANWRTYTNPKFNYSFKYPKEWDQPLGDESSVILTGDQPIIGVVQMEVDIENPEESSFSDDSKMKLMEVAPIGNNTITRLPDVKVDTENGLSTVITDKLKKGISLDVHAKRGSNIYRIVLYGQEQYQKDLTILRNQILSTFKFLN